jgi:uncharacterized membrane protein YfcA
MIILMMITNSFFTAGAGILIPLSMAFFGFNIKYSIGFSNISTIISTLIRFGINFKRNMLKKNTDGYFLYTHASIMIPSVCVGSFAGNILIVILPDLILCFLNITITMIIFIYWALRYRNFRS